MSNSPASPVSPEIATLGGGCFWCVEGCYLLAPGVLKVVSGYMGGHVENPTYAQVCTGTTGVAEVVQVTFDPARISYSDLIDLFWNAHDPTQLNRQGNDVGTQYRSVIFTHSEAQRELAEASRAAAQQAFSAPIVTEITPASKFTPAEAYHQDYFKNNPAQPYCQFVVRPKVEKFKKVLAAKG